MRMPHPLHQVALTALQIPLRYAQQGRNLAWAAMGGARNLQMDRHHPEHDVVDRAAQSRFYYHAHPIDGGEAEHGHFHLFHDPGHAFHHLVALSLDPQGRPVRWFCTNRWVTGEAWPPPSDLRDRVARFVVHTRGKMAPVARWLSAMVQLYRDEIAELLAARDRMLAPLDAQQQEDLLNDRSVHVLTSQPMDLAVRVQHILNAGDER